ncbi:MAG TPA: hypothetical protein VNW24_10570 [Stellaceae bacterium]|jgi:hypothetical protein|nr:hypothetical protein [Stellaceae bacterium]
MSAHPNSLQSRDIACSLHPFTDLAENKGQDPQVIVSGNGIYDPKLGFGAAYRRSRVRSARSASVITGGGETADLLSHLEKLLEDTAAWINRQPQAA